MNEGFGRKMRGMAAGLTLGASVEAKSFDVHDFPKNADPATVSEFLKEKAQMRGHMTEAATVSVKNNGAYVSAIEDPGFGIVQSTSFLGMLDRIQKEYKIPLNGREVWFGHNHAADHIAAYAEGGGVAEDVITHPELLLNGPSLYDCKGFLFGNELFKKYQQTKVVNVIVEPGGNWVCSAQYPLKVFSVQESEAYEAARRALVIATQSKKKQLDLAIRLFEREAFDITGIHMRFVPHGATLADFENAKNEFAQRE